MSLEEALIANTAALKALTDVLGIRGVKAVTIGVTAAEVAAKRDATGLSMQDAKQAVIEEKKAVAKTEAKPESTSPTSETTSPESKRVAYDEVKKLILAISKVERSKAVALLAQFGAKGGTDLKPEQYSQFVVDAQRVLDGEYDPEADDE